MCVFPTKF